MEIFLLGSSKILRNQNISAGKKQIHHNFLNFITSENDLRCRYYCFSNLQINPLVLRLLNIVQNIVMPRLKPVDNLTVLDETSLHKMFIYLCEYKLDYSLDLAVCELRDNLISVNKSGGKDT